MLLIINGTLIFFFFIQPSNSSILFIFYHLLIFHFLFTPKIPIYYDFVETIYRLWTNLLYFEGIGDFSFSTQYKQTNITSLYPRDICAILLCIIELVGINNILRKSTLYHALKHSSFQFYYLYYMHHTITMYYFNFNITILTIFL